MTTKRYQLTTYKHRLQLRRHYCSQVQFVVFCNTKCRLTLRWKIDETCRCVLGKPGDAWWIWNEWNSRAHQPWRTAALWTKLTRHILHDVSTLLSSLSPELSLHLQYTCNSAESWISCESIVTDRSTGRVGFGKQLIFICPTNLANRKSHVTAHDKSRSLELVNSCCVFCTVVDEVLESVSKCWLVEHDNSKRLWCVQWIDVFCQKCSESVAEFCKSSNHLAMLVRQQKKHGFFRCCGEHIEQLTPDRVYGRFPDGYFPQMVFFPERRFPCGHFPGWSFSPYETFPRKTSWMVGLMFNCSWRWSLTERPYCVYLNGFTVNLAH